MKAKPRVLQRYRERFTHLLVDEFQDTNYAQFRLVKMLAGDHLCVVGDDDQTIYRFRGAYLTNMQDFREQYASCTEHLLEENYRSTGTILALALRLMEHAPGRHAKPLTTGNPAGATVTVADCANETAEALYVTREIRGLVGTPFFSRTEGQVRPMTYSDIAIICRRRADGGKFARMLKKNGIPAEFVGEADFFAEPVVRDIRAWLRAVENPLQAGIPLNRILKAGGIPETVVQRINAAARKMSWEKEGDDCVYAAMQQAETIVPDAAHLVRDIVATLEDLIRKKDRATLGEFIHGLLRDATGLYQRALAEENGQDLLFLNTFAKIVAEYESITRERTLADLLGYLDLLSGVSVEVGEREDRDAVRILTVHKSKGKEYPVVFVADMVKDRFPLSYRAKPFTVPADLAKGLRTGDAEKALFLQEERRLCYVAMTRAQERLTFTLAKRYGERKTDAQPSQFLFELDYLHNPLMEIVPVTLAEEKGVEVPDNPVDALRRRIRDQAVSAIEQDHLATAIQRIVELEKIRLLEAGKPPGAFRSGSVLFGPGGRCGNPRRVRAPPGPAYRPRPPLLGIGPENIPGLPALLQVPVRAGGAVAAEDLLLARDGGPRGYPAPLRPAARRSPPGKRAGARPAGPELVVGSVRFPDARGRGPGKGGGNARHVPGVAGKKSRHDPRKREEVPVRPQRPAGERLHRPGGAGTGGRVRGDRFQDRLETVLAHEELHQRGYPGEPVLPCRPGALRDAAGPGIAVLREGRQNGGLLPDRRDHCRVREDCRGDHRGGLCGAVRAGAIVPGL